MNQNFELFAKRYSCRNFTGELPVKEKLEAIALAGVMSPSAMNKQPWLVNVITDKVLLDEMDAATMKLLSEMEDKSMYERLMNRGGTIFYNAPCMYLILKQPGTDLDCGIITENITLAATALGLAGVICGMANFAFDSEKIKGNDFQKRAGFVDGYEFGMTVLVGFPQEPGTAHEPDRAKIRFI
ncbi:MAG: nitroreductase family protein [Lachnospiraceae bacterium]|nr:nitroreductase family protein [Lachnospiraceae bacterium]